MVVYALSIVVSTTLKCADTGRTTSTAMLSVNPSVDPAAAASHDGADGGVRGGEDDEVIPPSGTVTETSLAIAKSSV